MRKAVQTSADCHFCTKDGYLFDVAGGRWTLSRDTTLSVAWIDKLIAPPLQPSVRSCLQYYAENYSASHTAGLACEIRNFALFVCAKQNKFRQVRVSDLISYRATFDRLDEYRFGKLSLFLRKWISLSPLGTDPEVISFLKTLTIRGNIQGRAVQTLCPREGPLSELEFSALRQALVDGFETDNILLADLVLAQLFMATGRRPAQLADLKALDLQEIDQSHESAQFLLNVPRRKIRGSRWREHFKLFALQPEMGEAIKALTQQNNQGWARLGQDAADVPAEQRPIFPRWSGDHTAHPKSNVGDPSSASLPSLDRCHLSSHEISARLERVVSRLNVPSERTGATLSVFPTRLRRTLATRAARQGYGILVIAELLDHTTLQAAKVYTENVPEHVDAIDEAVARQLAPLAQAFAGVLVEDEQSAVRGEDPKSRLRNEAGPVGTCGQYGFCGALAPIACYTCRNFQPWRSGVHKDVLKGLLHERGDIFEATQDPTIASINDRTILAVTQVIQLCTEERPEANK